MIVYFIVLYCYKISFLGSGSHHLSTVTSSISCQKRRKMPTIAVPLNYDEIVDASVEMATVNG